MSALRNALRFFTNLNAASAAEQKTAVLASIGIAGVMSYTTFRLVTTDNGAEARRKAAIQRELATKMH